MAFVYDLRIDTDSQRIALMRAIDFLCRFVLHYKSSNGFSYELVAFSFFSSPPPSWPFQFVNFILLVKFPTINVKTDIARVTHLCYSKHIFFLYLTGTNLVTPKNDVYVRLRRGMLTTSVS